MSRRFNQRFTRTARPHIEGRRRLNPVEIFRKVMQRYYSINDRDVALAARRATRDREFIADIELTGRRILSPRQYQLFRTVFLWKMDRPTAALHLKITQLDVALISERVESLLGTAFRDTKPYPIYPIDEYFREPVRKEATQKGC